MSVTPRLPDNPADFQRRLDDLLRRNDELRQQAESAQRRPSQDNKWQPQKLLGSDSLRGHINRHPCAANYF
jgi:hypothetical protein